MQSMLMEEALYSYDSSNAVVWKMVFVNHDAWTGAEGWNGDITGLKYLVCLKRMSSLLILNAFAWLNV